MTGSRSAPARPLAAAGNVPAGRSASVGSPGLVGTTGCGAQPPSTSSSTTRQGTHGVAGRCRLSFRGLVIGLGKFQPRLLEIALQLPLPGLQFGKGQRPGVAFVVGNGGSDTGAQGQDPRPQCRDAGGKITVASR